MTAHLDILSAFTAPGQAPFIIATRAPNIGDIVRTAGGAEFYWTQPMADYVATSPTPGVPQVVTRFQARAALLNAGLLDDAAAAVAQADAFTQLVWNEASEWRRDNQRLIALATAIGLTSGQIDDLFRAAADITA